jgi:RNA polymerase sigma-70 factor (ECF subfamily)
MAAPASGSEPFATTHWSLVLNARGASVEARAALSDLCQRYWPPLYVYVRRRIGDLHEARDLTQEFFARVIEKDVLARADPIRGRFRSFLLTALQHFLTNEWHKARARKRGGGRRHLTLDFDAEDARPAREPSHDETPERLFERQWALTLLDQVLARLRAEQEQAGKAERFNHLKELLMGEHPAATYALAAKTLHLNETAVRVSVHRLRKRFRELLRQEVAQTVADPADVDEEIRDLLKACAR